MYEENMQEVSSSCSASMKYTYSCDCNRNYEREYGFTDKKPLKIKCSCGKMARRKYTLNYITKGEGFVGRNTAESSNLAEKLHKMEGK